MLDLFRPLASRDHPLRQAKRTLEQIKGAGVLPMTEQLLSALQDGVAKLDSEAERGSLLALLDPAAQDVVRQLKLALAETEPGAARIGLLLRHGQQFINAFYFQLSEVVRKGAADQTTTCTITGAGTAPTYCGARVRRVLLIGSPCGS